VIFGPTAVGKTSTAIAVAERLGGEIVSCDSRQVFRNLDIGTAKPSAEDRARVRFHLIDVAPPVRFLNAFEFKLMAENAIRDILDRGRVPIMTVGTGFYLKVMTDGIVQAPSADKSLRAEFETIVHEQGAAALHKRLAEVDPDSASALKPNDTVRVIRALELYHLTGKTRSQLMQSGEMRPSPFRFTFAGLSLSRDELYRRIDLRCIDMLGAGLLDEARNLKEKGILSGDFASKIVGYSEVCAHLDGLMDEQQMLSKFQQATRNYAKRQMTWFRKHPGGPWFDELDTGIVDKVAGSD
jgi:tRNA dimethylallyltransferase